ncbi:hypothetical protein AAF712_016501 [Marasmius tenuissimus]|uniref:Uncharacterized protein n=1 Tax=Marasmius tenuissimus TaxID=585030 RepID=A0ABR2Z6K9_9AGAR
MELTKLNMSGVGYKQQMKISQAFAACTEAIKKEIAEYNHATDLITPPHDHVTWAQIVQMVLLADFDLLKETEFDLTQLTWAKEEYKEVMHKYFQILHAQEEVKQLNIEIKRNITSMLDNNTDYFHAEWQAFVAGDTALATELAQHCKIQSRFNAHIAECLVETSKLKGFTGTAISLQGNRLAKTQI